MAQRAITIAFNTTGQQTWVPDADCVYLGGLQVSSSSATVLISTDPSLTFATVNAANKIYPADQIIDFVPALNRNSQDLRSVPLVGGRGIFVTVAGGACFVMLLIDDLS